MFKNPTSRWRSIAALAFAVLAGLVTSAFSEPPQSVRAWAQPVSGAYLGIEMADVTSANMSDYQLDSERGVIVHRVVPGSPAEAGGILKGDVILEFMGLPVLSTQQFARLIRETPVGREVELGLSRNGARMNLKAKLGESQRRQQSRGDVLPPGFERNFRFEGPRSFRFDMPEGRGRGFGLDRDSRPRLGVTLQPLSDQMAEFLGVPGKAGALVSSVLEDSAAHEAGLRAGDVVIQAGERAVRNPDDLVAEVSDAKPGSSLSLKLVRNKLEMSVTVQIGNPRQSPGYRL